MSLKSTLRLNVAWAAIMFIAFALLEIGLHTATRLVMLSLTILYLGVAILALRGVGVAVKCRSGFIGSRLVGAGADN